MKRPAACARARVSLGSWTPPRPEPHAEEPAMKKVIHVGLDVHQRSITVAELQAGKEPTVCEIPNAPALIPKRAGERVKTDSRDAVKLARLHRAGELTAIRVPDREQEGVRDLVRAREDVRKDLISAKHRLAKFLLRHGRIFSETKN